MYGMLLYSVNERRNQLLLLCTVFTHDCDVDELNLQLLLNINGQSGVKYESLRRLNTKYHNIIL